MNNREGGEGRGGANKIVRFGFVAAAEIENFHDVGGAEIFAASAFWRLLFQISVFHQGIENLWNEVAALCEVCVFVVAPAAFGEMLDQGVDEHVAGAGVEGENVGRFRVCGDYGDVSNAADVKGDAAEFLIAIQSVIGERD